MKQEEIIQNMTKGVWRKSLTQSDCIVVDTIGKETEITKHYGGSIICESAKKHDVAAIVSAVNNTYGQNISPEIVPEMVRMLTKLSGIYELPEHLKNEIINLLNSLKLQP